MSSESHVPPWKKSVRDKKVQETLPCSALRVLILEDHEDTRNVLARLLRSEGYTVEVAASISSARKILDEEPVDVLLADLILPDGNACSLMSELINKSGPVGIAFSGHGTERDIALSLRSGFSRHLIKPVEADRLNEVISEISARRSPPGEPVQGHSPDCIIA